MRRFSVTARGLTSVQVEGRNWVVALGLGLAELGKEDLTRLACEVLPNGTVIARDIASGTGFVVQALDTDEAFESAEAEEVGDEPTHSTDGVDPFVFDDDDGPDDTMEVAGVEELPNEPSEELSELPADAIKQLDPRELQRIQIDDAETILMACHRTLEAALVRVPAESGAVILEEHGHMRFTAVSGPHSRKLMGVRLPMGTGVAGFALEKGRVIVVGDAHEDPRHCGEVDALTGYTTRAIVVVPIQHGDQTFGVVELMNLSDGSRFTDERVDDIRDIAGVLGQRLAEDHTRTTSPASRR